MAHKVYSILALWVSTVNYLLKESVCRFASTRPLIKGLEVGGARCSAHMKKCQEFHIELQKHGQISHVTDG